LILLVVLLKLPVNAFHGGLIVALHMATREKLHGCINMYQNMPHQSSTLSCPCEQQGQLNVKSASERHNLNREKRGVISNSAQSNMPAGAGPCMWQHIGGSGSQRDGQRPTAGHRARPQQIKPRLSAKMGYRFGISGVKYGEGRSISHGSARYMGAAHARNGAPWKEEGIAGPTDG
jgi:hypothetical protein